MGNAASAAASSSALARSAVQTVRSWIAKRTAMGQSARAAQWLSPAIGFAVALVVEGAMAAGLYTGHLTLPTVLAGHMLLCAGLGAFAYAHVASPGSGSQHAGDASQSRSPHDSGLIWLTIWTALAGPAGPLLTAIGWAGQMTQRNDLPARFDDLLEGDAGDPASLRIAELCDALDTGAINTGPVQGLTSLMGAIENGTQSEALAALRVAAREFGPDLAPVIRKAALSQDAAVRVLAATVLANLKKRFSDEISAARLALAAAPGSALARQRVFEAHMSYAKSGLLSDDLAREMRRDAFVQSGNADAGGHAAYRDAEAAREQRP